MYAATKAAAERHARALGDANASLVVVYPSMVIGPDDPTVGGGPGLMVDTLRLGRVLVTEGGLPYTDVRDLADLFAAVFASESPPARLMSSAHFLRHDRYHALLCALTGRDLAARRIPGWLLRAMGRMGDVAERALRRPVQLTSEAAEALTHMVPVDDGDARALLGRDGTPIEDTLRDTIAWMHASGVLEGRHVGRLAHAEVASPGSST
jgi:nucleoside-diphosphate-sugar epimerase